MRWVARTKTALVLAVAAVVGIFALDRGAGLLSQNAVIGLLIALCFGLVVMDRWIRR